MMTSFLIAFRVAVTILPDAFTCITWHRSPGPGAETKMRPFFVLPYVGPNIRAVTAVGCARHISKVDYDAPLSAETIFKLINGSIQCRQPLYLVGANINGANLPHALMPGARLANAKLIGTNLQGAFLGKAWLPGADVRGADLRGACLSEAIMNGANLRFANLRKATVSAAHMEMADLREADLTNTVVKGADMQNADLRGADLYGADLEDAKLEGAKYTTVEGTLSLNMEHMPTIWPEGFDPEAAGCHLVD
jgi:hypothetical protein